MVREFRFGLIAPSTTVNGETAWLKELVPFTTLTGMFIKVNFRKIVLTVMVFIFIPMDRDMKDIGKMICKKATAKKN